MMDHADARALLHGYIDGELDAASALALERHLSGCAECQRERAALMNLRAALRKDVAFTCPPELAARLRSNHVIAVLRTMAKSHAFALPPR